MDQGSSSFDLVPLLERLARLEAQVAAQQATMTEQQRIIVEQRATISLQHEALQTAHEQITLLKKSLFAPRRERYIASPDQKLLFETGALATQTPAPLSASHSLTSAPKKPRSPPRKFVFPDFLPVVRHEHSLEPGERACGGCGGERTPIQT